MFMLTSMGGKAKSGASAIATPTFEIQRSLHIQVACTLSFRDTSASMTVLNVAMHMCADALLYKLISDIET